jgi:hypothetical protein
MSIFNRHTAYERLVTEHVDGLLDEAGEAKLQQHLSTCPSCAVEVREQQAVRTLLMAQPMVAAPRSFALPYAPRQVTTDDSRVTGWLRGMQVATATAALVLVALVGINVVDPTGDVRGTNASADQAALSAAIENANKLEAGGAAPEAADGVAPPASRIPEAEFSTSIPNGFAPEGALPEGLIPEGLVPEPAIGGELAEPDGAPSLESPATELLFAPKVAADADIADDDRSALEWALLVASAVTAVLAMSVVAVTWRAGRPV